MREAARPVEKKMNKGTKQEAVRVEATGKTGGLVEKIMRDADEADEPDEESSEISRFQVSFEHGTAGATSIFEDAAKDAAKFRPALAFKSQIFKSPSEADRTYPWISVGQFPQTVYFRFPDPLTITKFSFRSRAEDSTKYPRYINLVEFSPTKFDFVGSDDCSEWETIMEARGVTWSTFDQEKLWIIPKEKQKSFACFGIRIVENGGNSFGTHGAIQGMKMWQSTGTTTSIDCYKGDRASYRGRKTSTSSGRICQNWASQSPQKHGRTPEKYPNSDLTSNYCRNPDGELGPWCYTTDSKKRWEYCGIPKCSVGECYPKGTRGEDYRGHANVTVTGSYCKPWKTSGKSYSPENCCQHADLVENYCRNPSKSERPWCYSTNKGRDWEYCDIPECGSGGSCASNPCKYGTCFDELNDYRCVCDSSWGGKNCDKECYPKGTRGEDYRGHENVTVTGSDCKPWKSSGKIHTPKKNPNSGLEGNYCRNPSYTKRKGGTRPWCYSTNKKAKTKSKWEYCDIPECADDSSKAFSADLSLQVTAQHGTGYNGNSHYGNVMVAGRPICDNNWDDLDAKVVCRQLGFNEDLTKAIASCCSLFGSVPTNFRVGQVHCQGPEQLLGDCSYEPRSNCGGGEAAGVVCVDPTRLNLRGGTANGA